MDNFIKKFGFVNIIGATNVGKSTLINRLVGQKVSIVTRKVQTTRNNIIGILSSTVVLWIINLIIPAIIGSLFIFNLNFFKK